MRAFRSPSHAPGLALAGAAFTVVAVIFGTARGLVSFHFRPADPPRATQHALVLPAPPAAPAARVVARSPARPSRPAPPPTAAATVQSPRVSPPPAAAPLPPAVVPAPGVARRQPQPQPQPQPEPPAPPPPPRPPVRAPQRSSLLRPVGDLVGETTTGLARALRTTTQALASATGFVSPVVATVLTQAGELLGDTVEGVGQALGLLLGTPPDEGAGAGAPTPP
jgi:predicted lipid-binding transport protein (Tim44 family)